MKKKKTVYGVYNLVEWQAIIKVGKATVKVPFTGGAMTTQGVTPAKFTTSDPIIQFAIERSGAFKSGKIKRIKTYPMDGEVAVERNAQKPNIVLNGEESVVDSIDESANGCRDDVGKQSENDVEKEMVSLLEMEFDNNDDAKDYLEMTFGCIRSKLKNRQDIVSVGKANGVDIKFT